MDRGRPCASALKHPEIEIRATLAELGIQPIPRQIHRRQRAGRFFASRYLVHFSPRPRCYTGAARSSNRCVGRERPWIWMHAVRATGSPNALGLGLASHLCPTTKLPDCFQMPATRESHSPPWLPKQSLEPDFSNSRSSATNGAHSVGFKKKQQRVCRHHTGYPRQRAWLFCPTCVASGQLFLCHSAKAHTHRTLAACGVHGRIGMVLGDSQLR